MKKTILLFALFLLIFTVGCSSDDDNNENQTTELNNAFLYQENEYTLKAGSIAYWGEEEEGVYAWDIELFTSNFEYDNTTGDLDFEEDNVSAMFFELNTDNEEALKVGVYTIDEDNFSPFVCSYTDFYYNCDISNLDDEDFDIDESCQFSGYLVSGTVEILEAGTQHEIKVDAVLNNGQTIKAHYKGVLINTDDEEGEGLLEVQPTSRKQRRSTLQ